MTFMRWREEKGWLSTANLRGCQRQSGHLASESIIDVSPSEASSPGPAVAIPKAPKSVRFKLLPRFSVDFRALLTLNLNSNITDVSIHFRC